MGYVGTLLYLLVPLLVGMGLRHFRSLRPITEPAFRWLDVVILWIVLPIVVFVSIARCTPSEFRSGLTAMWIALLNLSICFSVTTGICLFRGLERERMTAIVLSSAFMNVGHLGLPLVYATMGTRVLASASFYAIAVAVPNLILGVMLVSSVSSKRVSMRSTLGYLMGFPAMLALFFAFLFVIFKANLPEIVSEVFDGYLAKPFFLTMLLFAGYCLEALDPRKHVCDLLLVGTFRFLVSPLVTLGTIAIMGLNFATDISPKPSLMLSMMPPGIFNLILAHTYKQDLRLYGALVFYPTLVSLLVALPISVFFIS